MSAIISASPVAAPSAGGNVHNIFCKNSKDDYQGTGWFIKDGIMATALHVASIGNCRDSTTGKPLQTYATDKNHDFALMSGSTGTSVIAYSCKYPKPNTWYRSYGYSSDYLGGDFWHPKPLYFDILATNQEQLLIPGLWNIYPMRLYQGAILHGMSGGPVTGTDNVAIALNNAGTDTVTDLYDLADTALCTGKWDTQ